MRTPALSILALLAVPLAGRAQNVSFALAHVTVIDMTGAPPQSDMTVVVTGNRIATVGPSRAVRIPKGAPTLDATGKFLIPGLWDMHVHAAWSSTLPTFGPLFLPAQVRFLNQVLCVHHAAEHPVGDREQHWAHFSEDFRRVLEHGLGMHNAADHDKRSGGFVTADARPPRYWRPRLGALIPGLAPGVSHVTS